MTMLYSSQGTIRFPIAVGQTLIVQNISGVETVSGSSSSREDASARFGSGYFVYGPQTSAGTIQLSTTGQLDYQLVVGDATPWNNFVPLSGSSSGVSAGGDLAAGSAAVAAALGGAVFGETLGTEDGIRYAAALALAAGGGIVQLQPKTYTVTSPLPVYSVVVYRGVQPKLSWTGNDSPDGGTTTLSGGTILQGATSFNCFEFNNSALGSAPSGVATLGNVAAGFIDIGFNGFNSAIKAGGKFNPSFWYLRLWNVYCTGSASWAIDIENWQHIDARHVYSFATPNGQRYACSLPKATLSPGNSSFEHIYHVMPANAPVSAKGIRFESYGTNAELNETHIGYIQCNGPSRTVLSPVTASMTSGSANIGVPNASLFEIGLPVFFSVSNTNGFNTANGTQTYFVVNRDTNSNWIQVSDTYGGTAKTSTATNSTQSVGSYGYPGIELLGWNGGKVLHYTLGHIDLETVATTGLLLQNAISGRIGLRNTPALGANLGYSHVCSRGSAFSVDSTYEGIVLDADTGSSVAWLGSRRGTPIQHNPGFGIVRDEQYSARIGVNLTEYDKSDFYALTSLSGDSVFFRTALQFQVQQRGSGETEAVGNGNFVIYNGAGGGSRTLPQITSDSHVGVIFSLTNPSSSSITWNTSGSQTINNKPAATAITIGAYSVTMVQAQKIGASYIWAILGTSGTVTF